MPFNLNLWQSIGIIAVLTIVLLVIFRRHPKKDTTTTVPAAPSLPPPPPLPIYNGVVVKEAVEIGHGVFEVSFYHYPNTLVEKIDDFPQSLAHFIQTHPDLRVVSFGVGSEWDGRGGTRTMVVVTEPRVQK